MSSWTEHDVPGQHGRVAVVTGANSGIGLHVATVLARRGAEVVLACRSAERGERAAAGIPGSRLAHSGARNQTSQIDHGR
ncbi:MAG TPA: SDR family NAD(P)-dependent oxidoreductase [Actinocatenispora sp.]